METKDFFSPLQRRMATWKRIDRNYEWISRITELPLNGKRIHLVNLLACEIEELEQSLAK